MSDAAWEKFNTRTAGFTRYADNSNERDVFDAGFAAGQVAALEDAADKLAEAFSGLDYEENAQEASCEGEWSWFKWLAMTTLDPDWPNNRARAAELSKEQHDQPDTQTETTWDNLDP